VSGDWLGRLLLGSSQLSQELGDGGERVQEFLGRVLLLWRAVLLCAGEPVEERKAVSWFS
jgi:hypothetical protein